MWDEIKVPLAILAAGTLFLGFIGLAMSSGPAAAGLLVILGLVALFAPFLIGASLHARTPSRDEKRRFLSKDRVVFAVLGLGSTLAGLYAQVASGDRFGAGVLFTFALGFFWVAAVRR